ncbi:MAG TPA: hypothetical protein VGQ71_05145, partial [Terriglobales bacterium]|nr:hypothetical protein [Terriglobales bacterium]
MGAALIYEPVARDQNLQVFAVLIGAAFLIWGLRAVPNPRLALRYHLNPRKTVADLIREWTPQPARLESEYERSLHQFLKSKLPFERITRQYGSGRIKCDLAIGTKVMLELKNGLRTTSKLQRLLGQLDLYRGEWGRKPVIIVLLGTSEEDLLHTLNGSLRKY